MAQPEAKLSRKIMDALRLEGWFCWKTQGTAYTMSGIPDIICCAEGLFIGIETKMPTMRSNTSPDQKRVHQKIRDAGGTAEVACSPEEAIRIVRAALAARA